MDSNNKAELENKTLECMFDKKLAEIDACYDNTIEDEEEERVVLNEDSDNEIIESNIDCSTKNNIEPEDLTRDCDTVNAQDNTLEVLNTDQVFGMLRRSEFDFHIEKALKVINPNFTQEQIQGYCEFVYRAVGNVTIEEIQ